MDEPAQVLRVSAPPLPVRGPRGWPGRLPLVLEVLLVYGPSWRAVRTNDLERMVSAARRPLLVPRPAASTESRETALRLKHVMTRVLGVLPTDGRCLIQSLVLLRLLTHRAIGADLVIGVSTDAGFSAHAWIEHDGRAILPTGGFSPVARL